MITEGRTTGEIIAHSVTTLNDKTAVLITFLVEDNDGTADNVNANIFITEASKRIARAQLKACGFDPDTEDLAVLNDDDKFLSGKRIAIVIENANGYFRANIVLGGGEKAPPETVAAAQVLLRSARSSTGKSKPAAKRGPEGPRPDPVYTPEEQEALDGTDLPF